jgi:RNA polymerase sigma-70 factor (ECF subfamily)
MEPFGPAPHTYEAEHGRMRRATAVVVMQRALVERAIGGDRDAFADLVRSSASRQYAIATLILRDGDRAQDAVQEALVSAWKGLSALRDPDAWDAWLHRLTVRACFHQVRREKRRRLVELHVMPDTEPVAAEDAPTALAERDRIERALDHLPIDQRAVVVLHFHLGLPLTEVAQIVDVPVGTAKSRLSRGLEALRAAMRAEPEARPVPVTERAR